MMEKEQEFSESTFCSLTTIGFGWSIRHHGAVPQIMGAPGRMASVLVICLYVMELMHLEPT